MKKSIKRRVKAAENGNIQAKVIVAGVYLSGDASSKGVPKGEDYYNEAAKKTVRQQK